MARHGNAATLKAPKYSAEPPNDNNMILARPREDSPGVKKCRGSEISPYLQANRLAHHSFLDSGRRPKTPRSETKDSLTYSTASSMSFIYPSDSTGPSVPGEVKEWPRFASQLRNLEFREPHLL